MGNKLFIGNLSFQTTQSNLEELFGRSGSVESAKIPTDRYSGKPRGFAFVEMSNPEEAQACISKLDGYELDGRPLSVAFAKPLESNDGNREKRNFR